MAVSASIYKKQFLAFSSKLTANCYRVSYFVLSARTCELHGTRSIRGPNEKIFIVVLIAIGIYGYIQTNQDVISVFTGENIQRGNSVADAYQNQLSNVQVSGSGSVSHILSDDNKGSRHQRFVIGLSSGQTLLVAHNIDLALK